MMGPEDDGQRPNGFLAGGIILSLMIMLGGILWVYRSAPVQQAAATTPLPSQEGAIAALDSAKVFTGQSQWSKADAVLLQACVKFPDHQGLRVARAECLTAMKRYPEAYEQYEKALAIGPRQADIEIAAGVAASKSNQTERAVEHFSMAQTVEPQNAEVAISLAQVQRKQNNIEACKANLLRAAHLQPNNAFTWGTLADIALGENNVNLALQHIAKARTLQPESTEWRIIEARAHKRKGEPDKALTVLHSIEARQRKEASVARLMAECYGMLGRPVDAASIMGDASLASPTDATLAYDAALAFERCGNRAKAIEFAKYAKASGSEAGAKLLAKLAE